MVGDVYDRAVSSGYSRRAGVAVVALLAAGCSHPVRIGRGGVVHVALTEYRVRPGELVARAGALRFEVRNYGRLSHNLVISAGSAVLGSTRPIPPGQSATVSVTLAPGHYSISSSIQSDGTLGDRGTLLITR